MAATHRRRVLALPSQQLAHVGPVFLFDVGVVVFFVGTPAGELNVLGFTPAFPMPIDELRAVVGVQTQQGKRQAGADLV